MKRLIFVGAVVYVGMVTKHESEALVFAIVVGALLFSGVHHDPYPWQRPTVTVTAVMEPPASRRTIKEVVKATVVVDEDAVRALMALDYSRKAAIAALTAVDWAGSTTEERVVTAMRGKPPTA